MKLTGNLKKQVENEGTKEGRKKLIEKAGMKLTDDELERVAGGSQVNPRSGTDGLFGSFSASGSPQLNLPSNWLSYQEWQEQHPNATDEELRAFWESQQGN